MSLLLPSGQVATSTSAVRAVDPNLYRDLIGRPFAWGGRGPHEFDCYGIVRFIFARAGIEIPDYPSTESGGMNALTILAAMQDFVPSVREGFSIATFRMDMPNETHVGLMLDTDRFIHITDKTCVVIERLSSPLWKRRVVGFYQWRP